MLSMIVNLQCQGWEVIYHRAHALLAAQIAGYWDFSQNSYRLYETIAAISHHDDLEKEWEDDQLTAAGAPLDFTLERETAPAQLHRHVAEALYRGRWVALLTSMHLCYLNQAKASKSEDIADFLSEQHQLQAEWRDQLKVSKEEALSAYNFMRWCDRLSLILCQRQVPSAGRTLEITTGPDNQTYWIHQSEEGQYCVSPWPFTPDTFTVNVDTCHLPQLQFASNDELTCALKAAPRHLVFWTLTRP
jgi:hypothetical protein